MATVLPTGRTASVFVARVRRPIYDPLDFVDRGQLGFLFTSHCSPFRGENEKHSSEGPRFPCTAAVAQLLATIARKRQFLNANSAIQYKVGKPLTNQGTVSVSTKLRFSNSSTFPGLP